MKLLICIAILLGTASTCQAEWPKKWTTTDTAWEVAYTVVAYIDWGQTRWMSRQHDQKGITYDGQVVDISTTPVEQNPFLGRKPSEGKINSYFAIGLVAHPLISAILPEKEKILGYNVPVRGVWQSLSFTLEAAVVAHNFNIGVRGNF